MKIKTLKVKNFRGYKDETVVDFEKLTALVKKMMWVNRQYLRRWTFFNDGKGAVKIDKTDVNIYAAR